MAKIETQADLDKADAELEAFAEKARLQREEGLDACYGPAQTDAKPHDPGLKQPKSPWFMSLGFLICLLATGTLVVGWGAATCVNAANQPTGNLDKTSDQPLSELVKTAIDACIKYPKSSSNHTLCTLAQRAVIDKAAEDPYYEAKLKPQGDDSTDLEDTTEKKN